MEVGLMEIVRSLNRSLICDTCFSLYRAIHLGGKFRGNFVFIVIIYTCNMTIKLRINNIYNTNHASAIRLNLLRCGEWQKHNIFGYSLVMLFQFAKLK